MSISLVGTPNCNLTATSTATVTTPSGIVAGDVLVLWCGTVFTSTTLLPSGFTNFANINDDGSSQWTSTLAYKIVDGTEPSTYTIGGGSNDYYTAGLIWCMSGVDTTTPLENLTTGLDSGNSSNGYVSTNTQINQTTASFNNSWWVKFSFASISNIPDASPYPNGTLLNYTVGAVGGSESLQVYYQTVNSGPTGLDYANWNTYAPEFPSFSFIVRPASTSTPTLFRMYASNGDFQAHSFVQAPLPANTAMRLYSNNTVHTASLYLNAAGKIRLYSNGQLSVNNTIIV